MPDLENKGLQEIRAEIDKVLNDNADVFADYSHWMNEVSGDIKSVESRLVESGVKTEVNMEKLIEDTLYQFSWNYYKTPDQKETSKGRFRLLVKFNGEIKPLLEQPFHVRAKIYLHLAEFIQCVANAVQDRKGFK